MRRSGVAGQFFGGRFVVSAIKMRQRVVGVSIEDGWSLRASELGTNLRRAPEKDCDRIESAYTDVKQANDMTRQQILDLYFMDARCKLIDLAAFLDRVERADGEADFRLRAFRAALKELDKNQSERAKQVLVSFSDPTTQPIPKATTKAACGAWPGTKPVES
ncbi:MAG: hypothetical protein ACYDH9_08395 [Limisphaerales bacterium]